MDLKDKVMIESGDRPVVVEYDDTKDREGPKNDIWTAFPVSVHSHF